MKLSPLAERLIAKHDAVLSFVPAIPARRKLVPISFVTVLTGMTEDEVLARIESGKIHPCFDIALHAPRSRREVRIWKAAAIQPQSIGTVKDAFNLENVVASILPPLGLTPANKADFKLGEFAYRLSASDEHVVNLIRSGALRESCSRSKKTESRRIAYEGAVQFLTERVMM